MSAKQIAFTVAFALCSALFQERVAEAQSSSGAASPPVGEFSVLRFSPAVGERNFLGVDGGSTRGHNVFGAGVWFDYANRLFALYQVDGCDENGMNCTRGTRTDLIGHAAVAHLVLHWVLFERLQIGLTMPLAFTSGDPFSYSAGGTPATLGGGSGFGVGDPRLSLKVNLVDAGGFVLGANLYGTAPLGQVTARGRYIGETTPTFGGHLIIEYHAGGLRLAANAGGVWRDGTTLFATQAGGQFTYAAALAYDLTPLVSAVGEVSGATTFSPQQDENALEGRVGVQLRTGDLSFLLGGGAGILGGVGVPLFRGLFAVRWAPVHSDSDHDGVMDNIDGCPTDAEDSDDYQDEDGCPESDNDQDGFVDDVDRCPNSAEDMDGEVDTDGCPERDDDHDGIDDGYDSCPHEAEDMDGDRDDDGCPDHDRDRDNIADDVDQCPDAAEDTDGWGDEDGCPETDFDADGLPDDEDQCPDQPEDRDGWEDEDGCHDDIDPAPQTEPHRRRHRHHD